jgi:hypothetical protein
VKTYVKYSECKTVTVCASTTVARRLVKRETPSACATVNCELCKREITLHCLCVSVIMTECVTNC